MIIMKFTNMQCNERSNNKKYPFNLTMPSKNAKNLSHQHNNGGEFVFLCATLGQSTLLININKIVIRPIKFFLTPSDAKC